MTASVPETSLVNTPTEELSIEVLPIASKGLSSIPDSLSIEPCPQKPNLIVRTLLNIALLTLHSTVWTVLVTNWFFRACMGYFSRQKELYLQLYPIAKKGDEVEITKFLAEHRKKPFAAGYLFSEFLRLPELYSVLPNILEGANVCLLNDEGFFCRRWSDHHDAYMRKSSHKYQDDQCFAIGHFLFWLDLEGNTRFQFEKSPMRGFFSSINHTIDYLRYLRDNEQQGVAGSSPHTEEFCIKIVVNKKSFFD
ncbi:MAG: hypothetical protein COT85_01025 [Chlamydiae bacterium CG10_big_fil_rev_8_21_14_0_10_42_34]|nr:MAG: hypothetical protein COT85_01025 [Chlamydiae bacterium CG10_big_fil_rev_8_21_14_0_10_42_34]